MGTTYSKNAISGTRDTLAPKYLEAMDKLLEYKMPTPPDGSFTVEEAAEQLEIERSTASKKLLNMYKDFLRHKLHRVVSTHILLLQEHLPALPFRRQRRIARFLRQS